MTRPALYYYAQSKQDLLRQCYEWNSERFRERLAEELGEGSGRERLTQFSRLYGEIVCDDVSRCFLASGTHHLEPKDQEASDKQIRKITVSSRIC